MKLAQEARDRSREVAAHFGLAGVLGDRGEYLEARESYGRALALVRELGESAVEVRVLNHLGDVLNLLEYVEEAVGIFKRALALSDEIADFESKFLALEGLEEAYRRMGDNESAKRYAKLAAQVQAKLK